jgi:hypothetical protein
VCHRPWLLALCSGYPRHKRSEQPTRMPSTSKAGYHSPFQ